ncbi:hypothetical protein DNTS_008574, partial [Danionella cerebrum]
MAARLLLKSAFRAAACSRALPVAVMKRGITSGGVPTDDEQATGLERKLLEAQKKGALLITDVLFPKDVYGNMKQRLCAGTKTDPHIVPSANNKRIVGCVRRITPLWSGSGSTRVNFSAAPLVALITNLSIRSGPQLSELRNFLHVHVSRIHSGEVVDSDMG